jgi:hypothetical protein
MFSGGKLQSEEKARVAVLFRTSPISAERRWATEIILELEFGRMMEFAKALCTLECNFGAESLTLLNRYDNRFNLSYCFLTVAGDAPVFVCNKESATPLQDDAGVQNENVWKEFGGVDLADSTLNIREKPVRCNAGWAQFQSTFRCLSLSFGTLPT